MASVTTYNVQMPLSIRAATAGDVSQILAFIKALAVYEREPDAVKTTEEDLLRDGFGQRQYFECLMAELDGRAAGFALFFFTYGTWAGRPGLFLEDLFVEPELRGQGIGKALLKRLAEIALERGCSKMKWEVLDWNQPAIDFYNSLGGEFLDDWRIVRLGRDAMSRLAKGEALVPGGTERPFASTENGEAVE